MLKQEIAFLQFISSQSGGVSSEEALAERFGKEDSLARCNALMRASLIEAAEYADQVADPDFFRPFHVSAYRLTIQGKDALAAEEKLAKQAAERDSEDDGHHDAGHVRTKEHRKKKSFGQKLVDCILLAAAIATILGFLFQYRDVLLDLFAQLVNIVQ